MVDPHIQFETVAAMSFIIALTIFLSMFGALMSFMKREITRRGGPGLRPTRR